MNDDITLQKFKQVCTALFQQRAKVDEMSAALKVETEIYDEMKSKIIQYLDEKEMTKFHVEGKGLIYTTDRFTVPVPKDIKSKKEFGKYLQEKGIFWEIMSVNSATLNSFYKEEMESAIAKGEVDFKLPGIKEGTSVRTLAIRKG